MPRDVVLLEFVLHEAAGDAEKLRRVSLDEVGSHESALDEGGLDAVKRVRKVQFNREKIDSAFEL